MLKDLFFIVFVGGSEANKDQTISAGHKLLAIYCSAGSFKQIVEMSGKEKYDLLVKILLSNEMIFPK